MKKIKYKGFSTKEFLIENRKFLITDIDLINLDIVNLINIIPGEVPHEPTLGTRIPLLTFENMTQEMKQLIVDDVTSAIKNEPRVKLTDVAVIMEPTTNLVLILVDLYYMELDINGTVQINIEK